MVARKILLLAALALSLSACGVADDRFGEFGDGYPANLQSEISKVDWSKAEKVSMAMSEFDFEPAELSFRKGQPYALETVNDGLVGHSIVAGAFFRAIAAKGLIYSDGESSFPLIESLYLAPGEKKTLLFVPLETGEFEMICDRPLHGSFGMKGRIRIQ